MSLLENILGQIGGNQLGALSRSIGADEGATQKGIGAALPVLLGALSRNASNSKGAEALNNALEKDHDGGLLDNIGDFLGKGDTSMGAGILKHILGGKQGNVENQISRASGLSSNAMGKLLPMLAPIVLGALGKEKKQQNLNAGGLADMLGGARRDIEKANPKAGGLLSSLLDQDGDGDLDLGDLTKGMLGRFMGR